MDEVLSGWFIKFEPNEKKELEGVTDYLKESGYTEDGEGIKQMLLDVVYGCEKQTKQNLILDAINENPEAVQSAISGVSSLIGKALNKKIFKK